MENIRCLRKKRFKKKKNEKRCDVSSLVSKTANLGRVDCSNGNRLGWDDVDWRVVLDYLNKPFLRSENIFFKLKLLIKKTAIIFLLIQVVKTITRSGMASHGRWKRGITR